jgi:hypothetical protein
LSVLDWAKRKIISISLEIAGDFLNVQHFSLGIHFFEYIHVIHGRKQSHQDENDNSQDQDTRLAWIHG